MQSELLYDTSARLDRSMQCMHIGPFCLLQYINLPKILDKIPWDLVMTFDQLARLTG